MSENELRELDNQASSLEVRVENVGGISRGEASLSPGVTLVSGQNASNKSSFLRALAGVLGGPAPPLKSDADGGSVRLAVGDEEHHLALSRSDDGTVVTDSRPFSAAGDRCELFVALTETNPIRQAVLAGEDLSDLLTWPVDTESVEAEIDRLTEEKRSLDERLEELDAVENRLPGLRARRTTLEEKLADVEARLDEKRDAVERLEAEVDDDPETAQLQRTRTERSEVRTRLAAAEEAVESLEAELDEVTSRLAETDTDEDASPDDLDAELTDLHRRKQRLTSTINALSPIVEMNAEILDEGADIPDAMTADEVVAELDPTSQTITCWTCGSTVERAEIAEQAKTVERIVAEKRAQREAVTDRIETVTEQKEEIESRRAERERLLDRREDLTDELARRREKLESLRETHRELETEVERLQQQAAETSEAEAELAAEYEAVTDLEYERGQLESDLERVTEEVERAESTLSERPDVERRRERVAARLRETRARIDRIEQDLVNTFNEMMQEVLDALAYDAVERIWLERLSTAEGGVRDTEFELHVVRTTDDDAAYDETVANLSKSERAVIGLVVALAGYLAHDVSEDVPFVVLDALDMFDADRLEALVEYFSGYADYVVAAVLPEDAAELADRYETVSTDALE
jgi:septal ring factor EnvC (AmiA/AmiB activator)